MRIVILAAATLLSTAAAAEPVKPPERFDHEHPSLRIVEQNYFDVDGACRAMFPSVAFPAATDTHRVTGCAKVSDGANPCWIVVPRRGEGVISEAYRAKIIRHERAHCNGWPSDHPE